MMDEQTFALKGTVVYTEEKERFVCFEQAYII